MANTITASQAHYQDRLSKDVAFKNRVSQHIMNVALVVMAEALSVANHTERVTLAKLIVSNGPDYIVNTAAAVIVNHANVNASISIVDGQVTTSVTDTNLLAAVTAMWNTLAGIPSGT